ncbi:hypothetical protein P154DRAFT_568680 [Amniculicola lignicola CBS 123094]|uniref:Uncharacterized protein n=1 Tax=Amniculicola lignicola CBS 123094 TaxID=1392246 RepID=A0A6A5X4G8_9PLEO|nr:hypothetical protein P154DRAFT_568680 [Amniculicola lignicola CBS 123094]
MTSAADWPSRPGPRTTDASGGTRPRDNNDDDEGGEEEEEKKKEKKKEEEEEEDEEVPSLEHGYDPIMGPTEDSDEGRPDDKEKVPI